jgi:hypothetical protein
VELQKFAPDIVYCQIPPNSLVKQCVKYKKQSGCKLVFDLTDMWPESLPVGGAKRFAASPLLRMWRKTRDKYIRRGDLLITECDFFGEMLKKRGVKTPPQKTVYLGNDVVAAQKFDPAPDRIEFCYLGSINNIIDIDRIAELLCAVNAERAVRINIIGDGEMREKFVNDLENKNIEVNYMGKVYDAEVKNAVFARCHFGLNVYKENLAIGLTIKSVDYFQGGLPIINTIPHDTRRLVDEYKAGINMVSPDAVAREIIAMTPADFLCARENVRKLFDEKFTASVARKNHKKALTCIISK